MSAERRRAARVRAQAKVNLFLRVLAREESGYHQLETLFCRLELADVVTVRTGGAARALACDGPAMPPGGLGPVERNLAYRAAAAYADATGWPAGFEIAVEKHIPVGGGLGGGSADAGAVLRALNALSPSRLPESALLVLASSLGADAPFLTTTCPLALAWGRGERMLELAPLPEREVVLACFPFGVNTAEAFGWLAAERRAKQRQVPRPRLYAPRDLTSWAFVGRRSSNDFEAVVTARHPEIAETLRYFEAAAAGLERGETMLLARMSGSGSTVFAAFDPGLLTFDDADLPGVRLVRTRTAGRVEEVSIIE